LFIILTISLPHPFLFLHFTQTPFMIFGCEKSLTRRGVAAHG